MQFVLSTLAVVASWVIAGGLLTGIGAVARRLLTRLVAGSNGTRALRRADPWIGLATCIAYLQLWSLIAPVDARSAVLPVGVGVVGLALALPERRQLVPRLDLVVLLAATLVVAWLANLSLGPAWSYDSGLYHFGAIEYASHFPAIPGLANLQDRFGASGPHFLFVALLGQPPWSGDGFHLANGLLAALLVAEIGLRLGKAPTLGPRSSFATALAAVLGPAVVAVAAVDPVGRVSSPSIDVPAFVLFAAGSLYLADAVERRGDLATLLAVSGSFALAAAVRPNLVPSAFAALLVAGWSVRRRKHARSIAGVGLVGLPVALALGWAGRQAVLSGLPFFPVGAPRIPVDWRISESARETYVDYVRSWARLPGKNPADVLGSWDWLGDWALRAVTDLDMALAFMVGVFGLVLLAIRTPAAMERRAARRQAFFAVVLPSVVGLPVWFWFAPDPRFAYGAIWLAPAALVAWSLPLERIPVTVAAIGIPLLTVVAISVGKPIPYLVPDGDGPFGSFDPPSPRVRRVTTNSGLQLLVPVEDDKCWRVLWCAPAIDPALRSRGGGREDGLVSGP